MALVPGGGIVAAGFAHANDSIVSDFALVRYHAGGALDTGFGTGGRVRTDFGGRYDEALAVAVQPDGKIVVAGTSSDSTGSDMAVARYNSNGDLDTTFDGDGIALVDLGSDSSANAVAVQPDGRNVTDFAGYFDEARALAIDAHGRLVVGGQACEFPGDSDEVCDFGPTRYWPGGGLDRSFGSHGVVVTPISPSTDEVGGLKLQADGRLVVAGTTAAATTRTRTGAGPRRAARVRQTRLP